MIQMANDIATMIDTVQLKEQVYFDDCGIHINQYAYSNNKQMSGLEEKITHKINNEDVNGTKLDSVVNLWGGQTIKTTKLFVQKYGYHIQVTIPPSLARQRYSNHKVKTPIKCSMSVTIPSVYELLKNLEFDEYLTSHGVDTLDNLLNTYILKHTDLEKYCIRKWGNFTSANIKEMMLKKKTLKSMGLFIQPIEMELAQTDFYYNVPKIDTNKIYKFLTTRGEFGQKNLKLYHNNVDKFDAEYTIGSYPDKNRTVIKTSNVILQKANGIEFRRGTKSSVVVKFYDHTRRSQKYQAQTYLPIYVSNGNYQKVTQHQKMYGKQIEDWDGKNTTLRYEVSIRNVVGGVKGVKKIYLDSFKEIEDKKITLKHLFDVRYTSIITHTLRRYLLQIFGDNINDEITIGGNTMDKWELIKDKDEGGEGFTKGLQIMAVVQLMEQDNMTLPEIKKKFQQMGVNYEVQRRLLKLIKDKDYLTNWTEDNVAAMNCIKQIYDEIGKV